MEIFRNVCKSLMELYDSDEVVDKIMKQEYFLSTALSGLYPIMNKKYRIISIFFLMSNFLVGMFHIVTAIRTAKVLYSLNFTLLSFMVQVYLLLQYCILLAITVNIKRKNLHLLHKEMTGVFFNYSEDHDDFLESLDSTRRKEKKVLLCLLVLVMVVGGNVMFICPIIDSNYGSLGFDISETALTENTPIQFDYPFPTSNLFIVLTLLQGMAVIFVVSTIWAGCLIFTGVVQYFTLHQKQLVEMLNRIESRSEELYRHTYGTNLLGKKKNVYRDERYQKCFETCLKKCFRHHQNLLRWFESMKDFLSLPLGISYGTGTIVIALSLLSVKTGTSLPGTAITSFMTCFLEVGCIALLSLLGQRVADLNEDLRMAMYNIKWYSCNNSIKSNMKIFQEMTLRPMQLSGCGLIQANLATFASVMNSAYSYYNLIMAF